jgi:hypothetical protein
MAVTTVCPKVHISRTKSLRFTAQTHFAECFRERQAWNGQHLGALSTRFASPRGTTPDDGLSAPPNLRWGRPLFRDGGLTGGLPRALAGDG